MSTRSLSITFGAALSIVAASAPVVAATPDGLDLVQAARARDGDAVRSLLARGADANARQADGATPLHWAAHWNDLAVAELLIQRGARVNEANDYGATPLWL